MKKEKVFKPWSGIVKAFVYDKDASFFDLMVPTVDTTKYAFILDLLMALKYPMFFTGNTGVGKSAMIQNTL
jgi:dynein heavy chain